MLHNSGLNKVLSQIDIIDETNGHLIINRNFPKTGGILSNCVSHEGA